MTYSQQEDEVDFQREVKTRTTKDDVEENCRGGITGNAPLLGPGYRQIKLEMSYAPVGAKRINVSVLLGSTFLFQHQINSFTFNHAAINVFLHTILPL